MCSHPGAGPSLPFPSKWQLGEAKMIGQMGKMRCKGMVKEYFSFKFPSSSREGKGATHRSWGLSLPLVDFVIIFTGSLVIVVARGPPVRFPVHCCSHPLEREARSPEVG